MGAPGWQRTASGVPFCLGEVQMKTRTVVAVAVVLLIAAAAATAAVVACRR